MKSGLSNLERLKEVFPEVYQELRFQLISKKEQLNSLEWERVFQNIEDGDDPWDNSIKIQYRSIVQNIFQDDPILNLLKKKRSE